MEQHQHSSYHQHLCHVLSALLQKSDDYYYLQGTIKWVDKVINLSIESWLLINHHESFIYTVHRVSWVPESFSRLFTLGIKIFYYYSINIMTCCNMFKYGQLHLFMLIQPCQMLTFRCFRLDAFVQMLSFRCFVQMLSFRCFVQMLSFRCFVQMLSFRCFVQMLSFRCFRLNDVKI